MVKLKFIGLRDGGEADYLTVRIPVSALVWFDVSPIRVVDIPDAMVVGLDAGKDGGEAAVTGHMD